MEKLRENADLRQGLFLTRRVLFRICVGFLAALCVEYFSTTSGCIKLAGSYSS
jgi:hypothetical protein